MCHELCFHLPCISSLSVFLHTQIIELIDARYYGVNASRSQSLLRAFFTCTVRQFGSLPATEHGINLMLPRTSPHLSIKIP